MTEDDKTGQLSQEQENALAELLAGATDEQAASVAGVTRQTVNTWRNHDATFAAELNRRRADLWAAHADRLRAMIGQALDVVAEEMDPKVPAKDRARAAFMILRMAGRDLTLTPTGSNNNVGSGKAGFWVVGKRVG